MRKGKYSNKAQTEWLNKQPRAEFKKKKNSKGKRKGPSCGEVWTGPRGKEKKKR